jgi:iron complex outermembrane receptor protein
MALSRIPTVLLGETPQSVEGSSPRHEIVVDSSFDISKNIQFDLVYRYVSALTALSTPAYCTGDARIAWRFSRNLELSVSGQNLLQPYHVEYNDDPGGPVAIVRNVYGTLAWTSR